jgi:hypothetical protein
MGRYTIVFDKRSGRIRVVQKWKRGSKYTAHVVRSDVGVWLSETGSDGVFKRVSWQTESSESDLSASQHRAPYAEGGDRI